MKKIYSDFTTLYEDNSKTEQDFQVFLEKNTFLIPRKFLEHHGIYLETLYTKVPMGNDYISDFMIITKNSANWTCIHIEIEDPRKKIFTKEGLPTAEYNSARTQVKTWEAWFKNPTNQINFKQFISKVLLSNMRDNPISHKFILIYGRQKEIKNDRLIALWEKEKNSDNDFYVMTWDSLFETEYNILNLAKFTDKKIHFINCPNLIEGQLFISGLNPCDFEIPANTVKQMTEKIIEEEKKLDENICNSPFNKELTKKTLDAISEIARFEKDN